MHVDAIAHDFIGGVLDGVDPARFRVLGNSDGIAKTPSEEDLRSQPCVLEIKVGVFKNRPEEKERSLACET